MIETMIASFVGAFMWDNVKFFNTAKEQQEAGYEWVYKGYKDRDPNVPAISITTHNGSEKVIWVLEDKDGR